MNLYQSLGYLVLGSRLRRLSDGFLSEINKSYQNERIFFDASWFPVFYLLNKNETLSIKELSLQMEVSHPAASQLITNLKSKDLVTSITSNDDARIQLIKLTAKGRQLLSEILPIWEAILEGMEDLINENPACKPFLSAIESLECAFRNNPLSERISSKLLISNSK